MQQAVPECRDAVADLVASCCIAVISERRETAAVSAPWLDVPMILDQTQSIDIVDTIFVTSSKIVQDL